MKKFFKILAIVVAIVALVLFVWAGLAAMGFLGAIGTGMKATFLVFGSELVAGVVIKYSLVAFTTALIVHNFLSKNHVQNAIDGVKDGVDSAIEKIKKGWEDFKKNIKDLAIDPAKKVTKSSSNAIVFFVWTIAVISALGFGFYIWRQQNAR